MNLKCVPQLEVDLIKEFLEFFISDRYRKKELEKIRKIRGRKEHSNLIPVNIHPAVLLLESVNYLIKNNPKAVPLHMVQNLNDLGYLTFAVLYLKDLARSQQTNLQKLPLLRKIKGRLLSPKEYKHVVYELFLAQFMKASNKQVELEILPQSQKWPDIKFIHKNMSGRIECKYLDSQTQLNHKLCYEILLILQKLKKTSIAIEIVFAEPIIKQEKITKTTNMLKNMLVGNINSKVEDGVDIRYAYMNNTCRSDQFQMQIHKDVNFFSFVAEEKQLGKSHSLIIKPRSIVIINKKRLIPINTLKDKLKDANKKLKNIPDKEYGILSIDISDYMGTGFAYKKTDYLDVLKNAEGSIKNELDGSHFSQISAVFLTHGQVIHLLGEEKPELDLGGKMIKNENAKNPIPEGFFNFYQTEKNFHVGVTGNAGIIRKGRIEFHKGNMEKALEIFTQATILFPLEDETWMSKGIVLSELGKFDEADKSFEKAQQLRPNNRKIWFNHAFSYFKRGNKTKAREYISKALKIDPNYQHAQNLLTKL